MSAVGSLDEWGPRGDADGLADLLRAFDARLLIDENGVAGCLGLVVELTIKGDIRQLVEEFMEQHNALF